MKGTFYIVLISLLFFLCGCVVFSITSDMENPFVLTLIWNGETLTPDPETGDLPVQTINGESVMVQVMVEDENGNMITPELYEWYLTGELIAEGNDTVYIDKSLEIGVYWLDVIVGKGDVLSSEQVDFIVQK